MGVQLRTTEARIKIVELTLRGITHENERETLSFGQSI